VVGEEHVRAGGERREIGRAGRHPGGEDKRRVSAVEGSQRFLQSSLRRASFADVHVAEWPLPRRAVLECRREMDRRGGRPPGPVGLASPPHRGGGELHEYLAARIIFRMSLGSRLVLDLILKRGENLHLDQVLWPSGGQLHLNQVSNIGDLDRESFADLHRFGGPYE